MNVFSIGLEEIDLIANAVPGSNKVQRMRSVFLLKGMASYLGTGTAHFTNDSIKETCMHYDAYDASNFAKILKKMASEVAGGKDGGYTLTAKGIAEASLLIKELISA